MGDIRTYLGDEWEKRYEENNKVPNKKESKDHMEVGDIYIALEGVSKKDKKDILISLLNDLL